jgi:hypothetical protein
MDAMLTSSLGKYHSAKEALVVKAILVKYVASLCVGKNEEKRIADGGTFIVSYTYKSALMKKTYIYRRTVEKKREYFEKRKMG